MEEPPMNADERRCFGVVTICVVLASFAGAFAADKPDAVQPIDRGLKFLQQQQQPDGGWQKTNDPPAITALVLRAFVLDPRYDGKTDFVARGYQKLLTYQLDSGGIYQDMLANYNTAIAISALAAANEPAFREKLERAIAFQKNLQWTETSKGPKGETISDKSNPWYGGWGYGNHARPDLSNAQFAIQALHDAGLKPGDPAYVAALTFLTRTQNNSETNDQAWATNDGGFVYTPANGGESEAGVVVGPDGKKFVRSYGSMTYAGLKSMIYAGLTKDDPRVKAAVGWIQSHWTLDENPAMREAGAAMADHGLYYYYYVYAHALRAYGEPVITDSKGVKHDWRQELITKLASLQREDGSWSGNKRWMESNPVLVTSYAVLALQEAQADLHDRPAQ
jgi:squalene-hopene/tetraprenyl-beta-curcumene cyclase